MRRPKQTLCVMCKGLREVLATLSRLGPKFAKWTAGWSARGPLTLLFGIAKRSKEPRPPGRPRYAATVGLRARLEAPRLARDVGQRSLGGGASEERGRCQCGQTSSACAACTKSAGGVSCPPVPPMACTVGHVSRGSLTEQTHTHQANEDVPVSARP
jgi:hypothetical protein